VCRALGPVTFMTPQILYRPELASLMVVNASTIETVQALQPAAKSSPNRIASTVPQSLHHEGEAFWVPYSFDHVPLNTAGALAAAFSIPLGTAFLLTDGFEQARSINYLANPGGRSPVFSISYPPKTTKATLPP
jgi:hypothetical protein